MHSAGVSLPSSLLNFHVWRLRSELAFTQLVTLDFLRVSLPSSFLVWMLRLELTFTQITCNCGVLQGQSALVIIFHGPDAMFGTHIHTDYMLSLIHI